MAKKKQQFLVDELRNGRWVRAFKERREIVVQVWNSGKPEGEPDGDWAMPGVLGVEVSVAQAISQTVKPADSAG
jgi:hypothetical protein